MKPSNCNVKLLDGCAEMHMFTLHTYARLYGSRLIFYHAVLHAVKAHLSKNELRALESVAELATGYPLCLQRPFS